MGGKGGEGQEAQEAQRPAVGVRKEAKTNWNTITTRNVTFIKYQLCASHVYVLLPNYDIKFPSTYSLYVLTKPLEILSQL